MNPNKNH